MRKGRLAQVKLELAPLGVSVLWMYSPKVLSGSSEKKTQCQLWGDQDESFTITMSKPNTLEYINEIFLFCGAKVLFGM